MAEKVTKMVLKVDLQCPRCYKKIKKILCQIPQIRDREFDKEANTVTIIVICCSPEKIRQKLCCKGGKTIKSIDIAPPSPPPEPAELPLRIAFVTQNPFYGPDTGSESPIEVIKKTLCCGWC